jgi:hypothetical protein
VRAVPRPNHTLRDYDSRLQDVASRDIGPGSRRTYRVGLSKYDEFATYVGLDLDARNVPWSDVFPAFLLFCVQDSVRVISPGVANGYVSHILKELDNMQIYDVRPGARTTLYNRVFTSLSNDYKAKCPRRLRVRIPFTIPFILWSFQYIRDHYPIPLQGALMAALAVGHAFSLRPGEFLATKAKYDTNRFLGANTTFAWFDGCPYSACQAHRWPTGVPSHISSLLDVRKNSQDQGSPVAVAANPSQEPGVFCCVRVITSYIRRAALTDGDPLLVHEACHLGDKTLLHVMKQCAVAMRIDPTRVSIGCLRKNVLTQMKLSTPDLLRRLQGGWRSSVGETHYWAHLLQVANENEHAVHNQGCASVEVIRTMFTTQAVGQKPTALPDTLFSFEGSEEGKV